MSISLAQANIHPDVHIMFDKLDSLLGNSGCIKSAQEVPKIVSLMKDPDSTTIINRCIILNVLQSTKALSTLNKFMEAGGWNILNQWLSDAKKSQNTPLLIEILQVLQKLPVSIAALKQGNMGKIVKQLSKHEANEVKTLASDILTKWMDIFREGQAARARTSSASSDKLEGGPLADMNSDNSLKMKRDKEREDKKAAKKLKKEQKMIESQPPLGPLVALGKPKDKLTKRARDLNLTKAVPIPEKKPKVSSPSALTDEDDKNKGIVVESNSFMNALSDQAAKWQEKKVKKANKTAKPNTNQTNKTNDELSETNSGSPDMMEVMSTDSNSTIIQDMGGSNQSEPMEVSGDQIKQKKQVSWANDKDLVTFHYFEMDESERINVSLSKNFLDAAQREKKMEREALSAGKTSDQLVEMMQVGVVILIARPHPLNQWCKPKILEGCVVLVEQGRDSNERAIQMEREGTVLAQLFLNKSMVAPTPTEPDQEPTNDGAKPKLIPLNEPNGPPSTVGVQNYQYNTDASHASVSSPYYDNEVRQKPHSNYSGIPMGETDSNEYMYGGLTNGSSAPHSTYHHHQQQQYYYQERNGYRGGGGGGMYSRGSTRGRPSSRGGGGMSNICKHFITHGCRLGTACRFLHITPEELAVKMSQERNDSLQADNRTSTFTKT